MVTIFQDAPNSTPKPLDLAVVWPTGLLPSPFPAELFDQALETQQFVNELYFRISLDLEFLYNAYKDMMETDKWIQKQVELMEKVRYKIRQQKTLIFNRADYLTHQLKKGDPISLKQVKEESNLIHKNIYYFRWRLELVNWEDLDMAKE